MEAVRRRGAACARTCSGVARAMRRSATLEPCLEVASGRKCGQSRVRTRSRCSGGACRSSTCQIWGVGRRVGPWMGARREHGRSRHARRGRTAS
eukprot:2363600-Prymnesium_polylepis.1